jgi:hypothetical protein
MSQELQDVTKSFLRFVEDGTHRWPTPAAIVDFGLDSEVHTAALAYAIRSQQLTPEELDAALGNGKMLTEIVQRLTMCSGSKVVHPYAGLEFHTSWDVIHGRDGDGMEEFQIGQEEQTKDDKEPEG